MQSTGPFGFYGTTNAVLTGPPQTDAGVGIGVKIKEILYLTKKGHQLAESNINYSKITLMIIPMF